MKKLLILLALLILPMQAADVRLAWNPNPADQQVSQYTLAWGTTSGALNETTTVNGGNTTSTTISGLENNTLYFFAIKASNATGESPFSPEIAYTTPVAPPVYEYLSKTNWVVTVSSEEIVKEDNNRNLAIDGNPDTFWHSLWGANNLPQFFSVDLGAVASVGGITYLPRQDGGVNGMIKDYDISTSDDGVNWTVVFTGEFENNTFERVVVLPSIQTRFIRLIAKTDWPNGINGRAAIAEFKVIGSYPLNVPSAPTGLKIENGI